MTVPITPDQEQEQVEFHEWFEREFPVANGTRERYRTMMMMDLMFAAWAGGQACAALAAPADHVADAGKMVSRWISVDDSLPKIDACVLAVMRGNTARSASVVTVSAICRADGKWFCFDDRDASPSVTHWMPMPAPPGAQP